jgi:hypothetical protein
MKEKEGNAATVRPSEQGKYNPFALDGQAIFEDGNP